MAIVMSFNGTITVENKEDIKLFRFNPDAYEYIELYAEDLTESEIIDLIKDKNIFVKFGAMFDDGILNRAAFEIDLVDAETVV